MAFVCRWHGPLIPYGLLTHGSQVQMAGGFTKLYAGPDGSLAPGRPAGELTRGIALKVLPTSLGKTVEAVALCDVPELNGNTHRIGFLS